MTSYLDLLRKVVRELEIETKVSYVEVSRFNYPQGYELYEMNSTYHRLARIYYTWNTLDTALQSCGAIVHVKTMTIIIGSRTIGHLRIL